MSPRRGARRWGICALLFFATSVNYLHRMALGILAPDLGRSIGWNEADYVWIQAAFQVAYGAGLLFAGRWIDLAGTRLGYAAAVAFWSAASMAHALARSVAGF